MDEFAAMKVIAVRAVETGDAARSAWSDADRAWASRAAAEVVGANATPDAFLARRAALAVERLGSREGALRSAIEKLSWRPWIGAAIVVLAFVVGLALDQVDSAQRVNILAPPVLGLLAWNVDVFGRFCGAQGCEEATRGIDGTAGSAGHGSAWRRTCPTGQRVAIALPKLRRRPPAPG